MDYGLTGISARKIGNTSETELDKDSVCIKMGFHLLPRLVSLNDLDWLLAFM